MALVTKAEFARIVDRSKGAVSHWIRDGKLKPPALVKQGRYEYIDVDEAKKQLAETLDLGQQAAQQKQASAGAQTEAELANNRRLEARAIKEEIEAKRADRDWRAEQGDYVLTSEMMRLMRNQMDLMVGQVDGLMRDLTQAAADRFQLDVVDVQKLVDSAFKEWRAKQEAAAREAVAALSETVPADNAEVDLAAQ